MSKVAKTRAPNLSEEDIKGVVHMLDGWDGRLTWDGLIEAVASRHRATYTRQALNQHGAIKAAFQLTKRRLAGRPPTRREDAGSMKVAEVEALLGRCQRLEAENTRIKAENERLLEQFVLWAYNANNRGLDVRFLSQPLPRIDRDLTRLGPAKPRTPVRGE